MRDVEQKEQAERRLRMFAALSRATSGLRDRAIYCERARAVLSADARDFTFVDLLPLERDAEVRWSGIAIDREPKLAQHDGAPVWLASLHSAYDDRPFAVLALGLGLGDREWSSELLQLLTRQLEQGLIDARLAHERAQDELTRTLFELSPVAICVTGGPQHRYLLANRSYQQMVNKTELVGRTIAEVWPEIVGTPLLEVFDRVYQTGEPFVTEEFATFLDRDGDGVAEECFFRFNLVASRDPAGHITGWTCTAAEITAAVRARREAQHARALAEQANRAKDEFLAMLGHELRNPLAPITTSLYLMEKQGDHFVPERETIQRQVDHLVRLVDDLLDVSRMTGGKLRLHRRAVELHDVVREAVEQTSALFAERGQRLALHVPERGLMVNGDPARLAQVVSNLLRNAAEYSPDGGEVTLDAQQEHGCAELTVRDRGIGISADMLPSVFELFVQERQAIDRARGGLGIGLAIVRGIVSAHEGSVRASSDGLGLGSAFVVELPLATQAQLDALHTPKPLKSLPPTSPLEPARILVVDDNRDAAHSLAQVLRGLGHRVEVAFDGEAALHIAHTFEPRLALLDIGLPALDGYALAGRLRSQQSPQRVRLVAVTGYGQAADRERAFAAGFDAHVVKPLRIESIEAILEDLQAEREQATRAV